VDHGVEGQAYAELDAYEADLPPPRSVLDRLPKISLPTMFVYLWILALSYSAQLQLGELWEELGRMDSGAVAGGDWWRPATALLLHADTGHLLANVLFGALFVGLLAADTGMGVALGVMLLSGILGNTLNACFYSGETHLSIGASTAVFGCIGVLAGRRAAGAIRERQGKLWKALLVPIGAGLAFLAWIGSDTSGPTDYMAHFWGLLMGILLGIVVSGPKLRRVWQTAIGIVALIILGTAHVPVMKEMRENAPGSEFRAR
jgi:rhomboid protease GluP